MSRIDPVVSSPAVSDSAGTNQGFLGDLEDAARNFRFWWFLAWLEIRQRYKRSVLGPLWVTLTVAIQIGILLFVFTNLFGMNNEHYVTWTTFGMISWTFVNGTVRDATTSLIKRANFLKERPISHIGLVATDVFKNVLLLFHLFPIYIGLEILIGRVPSLYLAQLLLTIPLLMVALIPVCLVISFISVRYRDFPPLVTAVMNGLYFLTPIFWSPEQFGRFQWIIDVNPFASALALIRTPLRGEIVAVHDLSMIVAIALIGWLVIIPLHSRYRARIVYWV